MLEEIIIFTDGGSRGNPGPCAGGFVLTDAKKKQLKAVGCYLGKNTNNFAEYTGMINALKAAKSIGSKKVTVYSDSELMVRQINGEYKVKSPNLKPLYDESIELLNSFQNWSVRHVYREKNVLADKLVNMALDKKSDVCLPAEEERSLKTAKSAKPVRLAVLLSGGGTTLLNLLEKINAGQLNAEIPLVISSLSKVAGVERAKKAGLNVKVIRKSDFADIASFSKKIEEELNAADIDLVIQAGWLCLWNIPARYENRVMNIHPALLPSFGGQGMWGHHVHQAVLDAGAKVSGCTVHFCTNQYDAGPIIVQRCCPVEEDDTADTLAKRVFEQECIAYPQAIKLFIDNRLEVKNGKVKIRTV